jgi:stage V sporulation protein S
MTRVPNTSPFDYLHNNPTEDTPNGTARERLPVEVLKVSTSSRPAAVAGAIAGVIRQAGQVEIQSIGAGATNQAIKAIAIARGYLSQENVPICFIPSFIDVAINDQERTAIRILVTRYNA